MIMNYKYMYSLPQYIKDFIVSFKKAFNDNDAVENAFTRGNCYHFAAILENLFDGYIMYNPVDNHFAFMDDETKNLWDITGVLGNRNKLTGEKNWFLWEDFKKVEPLEAGRIIEQCMYKVYEG